jgi:hypothetical protein
MIRRIRRKKSKTVSASELAQMGVCERLVVFEHHFGKRSTAAQRAALRRGLAEHQRFYREGLKSGKKGRCYVATLIFGVSWETAALRVFRDRVLRPYAIGRWLIGAYYRTAPGVCAVLERWPSLQPIARALLKPIVWLVGLTLSWKQGQRGI